MPPPILTQHYGTATGPLGFPLLDRQAFALDTVLKALPKESAYQYRKALITRGPTEVSPGERSDVSWISTEDPDRVSDVVLARGMNDSQFKLNPIVTLQHCYSLPPVGKSIWRKRIKDGELAGIKAKTQYPKRPDSWKDTDWPPDTTFSLIQAGLLMGKSIGFLPTKAHAPTDDEIKKNAELQGVRRIIDEWLLLEYACVYIPCQQNAVVEAVSKGVKIPDDILELFKIPKAWTELPVMPFTTESEVLKSIDRQINAIDFHRLARQTVEDGIDRARGRV
jgi:hypothetical protein